MGVYDEAREQLIGALYAWDFSGAFGDNPTYAGPKNVEIVSGWPYSTIDAMMQEDPNLGFMTKPIISIVGAGAPDRPRNLGNALGAGVGNTRRFGTLVLPKFMLSCWADEQVGASQVVERLAGEIQGCIFYNQNRLAAYRHLVCQASHEAFQDRPELWRMDLTVDGDAVMSYDA